MIKRFMLWYRAKTYCPVIDSLRSEPEMWITASAYRNLQKNRYNYVSYDSDCIYHKELDIKIENWGHYCNKLYAKRNGSVLKVSSAKLKQVYKEYQRDKERKIKEKAKAELNRVVQDAQTLRLKRIVELRKALAIHEADDFTYRLEN